MDMLELGRKLSELGWAVAASPSEITATPPHSDINQPIADDVAELFELFTGVECYVGFASGHLYFILEKPNL